MKSDQADRLKKLRDQALALWAPVATFFARKDVRATLVRAYADVKALTPEAAEQAVAALERDKRYLTDTY